MNIKDRFVTAVDDVKQLSRMSISQGEYDATLRRLNNRTDSMGIIYSALVQGDTLYVVAQRTVNLNKSNDIHETVEFYNCLGDVENYSMYELLMPVVNINLSSDVVDPRKFIGGRVLVTEIDNIPVKTEFIGQLDEINETPIKIARTVFRSIRNFIGPTRRLDSKDALVEEVIKGFGYNPEIMQKLMEQPVLENAGVVFNFAGEGQYTQDTTQNPEGVVTIKTVEDMHRHLNNSPMKSKKCHLPIKVFSAR